MGEGIRRWVEEEVWGMVEGEDVSVKESEVMGRVGRGLGWRSGIFEFMDLGLEDIKDMAVKGEFEGLLVKDRIKVLIRRVFMDSEKRTKALEVIEKMV